MKSTWTLPEGYGQKYLIDLKDNKKQFWIVNGLSILIMLALLAVFSSSCGTASWSCTSRGCPSRPW